MKIRRTKKGAKISLTANDVSDAVKQLVYSCYPEFARGYTINAVDAQPATAEAILVQIVKRGSSNDIGVAGQQGFGVGEKSLVVPGSDDFLGQVRSDAVDGFKELGVGKIDRDRLKDKRCQIGVLRDETVILPP